MDAVSLELNVDEGVQVGQGLGDGRGEGGGMDPVSLELHVEVQVGQGLGGLGLRGREGMGEGHCSCPRICMGRGGGCTVCSCPRICTGREGGSRVCRLGQCLNALPALLAGSTARPTGRLYCPPYWPAPGHSKTGREEWCAELGSPKGPPSEAHHQRPTIRGFRVSQLPKPIICRGKGKPP